MQIACTCNFNVHRVLIFIHSCFKGILLRGPIYTSRWREALCELSNSSQRTQQNDPSQSHLTFHSQVYCTDHKPTAYPMYRKLNKHLREILGSLSDKIALKLMVMQGFGVQVETNPSDIFDQFKVYGNHKRWWGRKDYHWIEGHMAIMARKPIL